MPVRYDMTFSGKVQGVGFRFTTMRIAKQFRVTGWVRNEPDGSVRCVVEGDRDELDRFASAVRERMPGNIDDCQIEHTPATGAFSDFSIR